MAKSDKVLNQFGNYIASSSTLTNIKSMADLQSETEFKLFVSARLNEITDEQILTNEKIWKSLLDNDAPNALQKLLSSIQEKINLDLLNLNLINNTQDQKAKFQLIQESLRNILANSKHKEAIEDLLWKEYLEDQKLKVPTSNKTNQLCDQHYQQTDADPLKRAFGICWREFLIVLNKCLYDVSNGECSFLHAGFDEAAQAGGEENQLQKLWRMQNGTDFPTPAAAPRPEI